MYKVVLEDTRNGKQATIEMEGVYDEAARFLWEAGTYTCDETRRQMFNRAVGLIGDMQRIDSGGTIFKAVSVEQNGVVIPTDE